MRATRREFLERTLALAMIPTVSACSSDDDADPSEHDASARDAAVRDASSDGAAVDAGGRDASTTDAGGDDSSDDAGTDASTTDAGADASEDAGGSRSTVQSGIDDNHGHTLVVPAADVQAGAMTFYMLTANGDHSHGFSVSAADFETLRTSGTVHIDSTFSAGHVHAVTLSCG